MTCNEAYLEGTVFKETSFDDFRLRKTCTHESIPQYSLGAKFSLMTLLFQHKVRMILESRVKSSLPTVGDDTWKDQVPGLWKQTTISRFLASVGTTCLPFRH